MMRVVVGLSLLGLVACSGGSGTGPGNEGSHDGGLGLDGAAMTALDAGAGHDVPAPQPDAETCTSTAVPTTIVASYPGFSLSVVDQDVYYIDPNDNAGLGALHHVGLDGTGNGIVVNPSPSTLLYGATAVGEDILYFEEDDPSGSAIHLYRTSRSTGGAGVQVGTGTFSGFGVNILGGGYAGIEAGQSAGVFAASATEIYVNDQSEISRVSLADGSKTVIATLAGAGGIKWPALVGATVFYKDGLGAIYSTPANATAPSGAVLGTQTCGSGNTLWMASYAGGFLCGASFGLDSIDATGTTKTHVIYTLTDKTPLQFNPSSVDGTTYYALPSLAAADGALYRMDTTSTSRVALSCAVRSVIDYHLTATDLVFVELRSDASSVSLDLKRLTR